jgi:hypothetical protein
MSDIEKPILTKAAEMYVHYCEMPGCKEWGGFGHSPSPSVPSRWWCWPHYPHKDDRQEAAWRARLAAVEIAENLEGRKP